jgi:hypothetical protein
MDNEKELKETARQAQWWLYAAWTLPFTALAGIFFFYFMGWQTAFEKAMIIGAVIFFTIAVYWWFWAVFKIKLLANTIARASKGFAEIKDMIRDVRDNLKD